MRSCIAVLGSAALLVATPALADCPSTTGETQSDPPQRIFGTVTGLSPLCVNGYALETPAETRFFRDGRASTRAALGLGHVVAIEVEPGIPPLAERVDIDFQLAGPIEQVDVDARRITVLGNEVVIVPGTLIRALDGSNQPLYQLERGDHIAVSGLRHADGSIAASRLDVRPAGSPHHVTGVAVPIGRDTLYVSRVRGQTADRMGFDPELRGQRVQLRGKWNPRRQQLDEAFVRKRAVVAHDTRTLSLEGIAVPGESAGTMTFPATGLELENGTSNAIRLRAGSSIRVLVRRDDRGGHRVQEISVRDSDEKGAMLVLDPRPNE